ncbi:50S ribosomal protein L13 [candidate division KSB1 bacterium]|nr:50S ribosomal protein L13 [candidate division KSB1 bacterium]
MKTTIVKNEEITRKWYVVDAEGMVLGRLATQVARILRGKHKPIFAPHQDTGDFVIIINAEKILLTGKKAQQKKYFHHTGYPGGGRFETYSDILQSKPERILEHAIRGMLPKNRLGRKINKHLKIYSGSNHPHVSQKPEVLVLK